MVHEVRDKERFFHEVVGLLKPTARFLLVEPKLHVRLQEWGTPISMKIGLCSQITQRSQIFRGFHLRNL